MTFHVGQKVVCIRDGWDVHYNEAVPKKGSVYTIRTVEPGAFDKRNIYLRLVEIVNPVLNYPNAIGECSFDAREFRPIVKRTTDISVFTRMLTPRELETVQKDRSFA